MVADVVEFPKGGTPPAHKGHTTLSSDSRPIRRVFFVNGSNGYEVDGIGVTKIEAYDEHGEQAFVPWVAVFCGDDIIIRIPARAVSVHYV